jgi:hypothetical protein
VLGSFAGAALGGAFPGLGSIPGMSKIFNPFGVGGSGLNYGTGFNVGEQVQELARTGGLGGPWASPSYAAPTVNPVPIGGSGFNYFGRA